MCVCGCVCVCWCVYVQVLYTSVCMCMMCMNVWGDKNETHCPFPPPSIPFTSPSSSLPPSWSCITLFLSFLNLLLLPSHFLALSFPLSVHVSIRSSLNHSLYSSFLDSPSRRYTHSHNQCQWVASVYSVHDFFDITDICTTICPGSLRGEREWGRWRRYRREGEYEEGGGRNEGGVKRGREGKEGGSTGVYYKHNPSSACIVYLHCWPQLG